VHLCDAYDLLKEGASEHNDSWLETIRDSLRAVIADLQEHEGNVRRLDF